MNKSHHVSHFDLFNGIYLALMPIQRQLTLAQNLLTYAKETLTRSYEKQVSALTLLRTFEKELGTEIKKVMQTIKSYSLYPKITEAVLLLDISYKALPDIKTDLQLLTTNTDTKEAISNLLIYLESLKDVQAQGLFLKEIVFTEMLSRLAVTLDNDLSKSI